ncbi:MAG: methyltransferase domain-containing protein [Oscillospiraceae bacterium]|nr:methyltransferase domain-containing protein [Oscillospiraceae bacterium]
MAGYGTFANCYDMLTFNVPYDEIAKYYASILSKMTDGKQVLDMGCGTGNLTVRLEKLGFEMIGQEVSINMLTYAAEKSNKVTWICQKMENTDLPYPVDAVISTLDSINHLESREDISKCFQRVAASLKRGGAFVFDVNTPFKHREILGENTFVYDVDGVYCVWQNTFCAEDCGVDIDLDLFFEDEDGRYSRGEEHFREIALSDEEICRLLEETGFEVVNIWEYLTFDDPKSDSEKMLISAKIL